MMQIRLAIAAVVGVVVLGLAGVAWWKDRQVSERDQAIGGLEANLDTVASENADLAELNRRQRQASEFNSRLSAETSRTFEATLDALARMKQEVRRAALAPDAAALPPGCPVVAPAIDAYADRLGDLARRLQPGAPGAGAQGADGDHPAAGGADAVPRPAGAGGGAAQRN